MTERWLVFEEEYEGDVFLGDYPTLGAVTDAFFARTLPHNRIITYGVVDDEPLRIYHLIFRETPLPGDLRGRRIQIAWVEGVDDSLRVIQIIQDSEVLNYDVPLPPGNWLLYRDSDGIQLEPAPKDLRGTGMPIGGRAVDPL